MEGVDYGVNVSAVRQVTHLLLGLFFETCCGQRQLSSAAPADCGYIAQKHASSLAMVTW